MTILALVIGLLAVTVVCVALGERLRLPYPILMLLASSAIACIPGLQHLRIDPELILPLFLPPLLFATAQRTDWSVFHYRWRTLLMLAVGLTAATAAAVAGTVWYLVPGVTLPLAMMVGAMVAPPDPVAVDAVAGPARMPRRLLSILQTEGLFNDAVAIVLFTTALRDLTGSGSLGLGLLLDFVIGAAIAVALGMALGFCYRFASQRVTTTAARTAMSVVVPFAAYIVADELHASGVIAVVVTALETRRRGRAEDSEARLSRATFWDVANLLVTGIAFGLMGMQLRDIVFEEGWDVVRFLPVAAVVCVVVIVIRMLGMLALRPIVKIDAGEDLTGKDSLVLTWCGMRGLATLALALAIPTAGVGGSEGEARIMMVIVACSVLLVTLVPTGLGLGWLLRLLKLQDDGAVTEKEIAELTHRAQDAALEAIHERFEESEELTEDQLRMVKKRFRGLRRELDSSTQAVPAIGPDGSPADPDEEARLAARRKKLRRGRELMIAAQTIGLDAARTEVLRARSEPGIDPEAVDRVLRVLDFQMLASPPRRRAHHR